MNNGLQLCDSQRLNICYERNEFMIKIEHDRLLEWTTFLKDVFICSLGAYGGPEAHYGVFTEQMVIKKKYLTEEELVEFIALTGILPGPSSTQTIVAIGYKRGGPFLALLTMLVWAFPVLTIMTLLSFVGNFFDTINLSLDGLRYIGPMAVGFIFVAAYRIGSKVASDKITLLLLLLGGITTYFMKHPFIYPIVLLFGGAISIFTSKEKGLWNHIKINPPWKYLLAFVMFALSGITLNFIWDNKFIQLFESFYRYGYLVIGGGQIVVPLMYSELVELKGYLTNSEFLTGFGLVQGLPGPMFSFSAYVGGMAARGGSVWTQIIGAFISGISIFLPGLLLIYFIYPIWEKIKQIKGIKISLKGISAVAGGLITVSGIILMQKSGIQIDNIIVTCLTTTLLLFKKIPAPIIVIGVLLVGFLLPM